MPSKKCCVCKTKLNIVQRIACECRCKKIVCGKCRDKHVCAIPRDISPQIPEAITSSTLVDKL